MDQKSWIGLTLLILGFVAWEWYYIKTYPPEARQRAVAPSAVQSASSAITHGAPGAERGLSPEQKQSSDSLLQKQAPKTPSIPNEMATLQSPAADYVFTNNAGGISQVMASQHLAEKNTAVVLNNDPQLPIGAMGFNPGVPLGGFAMQKDAAARTVAFTRTVENGIEITKRFSLPDPEAKADRYKVQLEISFRNPTGAAVSWPSYWVGVGNAAPIHHTDFSTYTQFDWSRNGKLSAIDVNWFDGSKIPLLGVETRAPAAVYRQSISPLSWASVSSQYFCTILNCLNSAGNGVWASRTPLSEVSNLQGIVGGMELPGFTLGPGETVTQSFLIYSGPKELQLLQALKGGQEGVLRYGPFKIVSEWLLWAMNKLHSFVGNYAWAIIILTLMIKLCLWPLQNKATQAMKRMAVLAPKVTELREKHKDDPQKMNEEMMKLYREYGVNPFGGCLPMLIQIPIFFGFYSMLGTSIELRNSSFLWIRDLSQPDTIAHILGFPINLLPLLMAGTMVWQMAISPKSGDAVQQRIFYFMPIIFLVFCYNYASGLALYWTTQNLFSIIQLYLTRDQSLPKLEKKSVVARREKEKTKQKSPMGLR